MKADFGDSMRHHKNNAIILLTLCSRACISGGLPPSVSYDMNDYYAGQIEDCNSMAAVKSICEEMLDSYVTQVQRVKEQSKISGPIQNSCYYIKTHTTSQLSLKELAKRAGYTEYYFSQKFKKEVGLSVNDFILNAKIEHAKLLLADTAESIQSISDRLAFGSRSYFYTCFQKLTGSSPSEYRRQNGKR
jgi:YesN/AraC family two-component response regulator